MNKLFKINGNSQQYEDIDVFHKLAQQFLPYAQKKLGFNKPVAVNLLSDPENVKDPLGKTAYYDPNKMQITLFVDKRHVKDILRSMAHELGHHKQNCRGEFDGGINTQDGYAQDDNHMRKMEAEAYLKGSGFLLRDWEDSLKKENKTMGMSTTMEEGHDCAQHEGMTHKEWLEEQKSAEAQKMEERTKRDSIDRTGGRDTSGRRLKPLEEDGADVETDDEKGAKVVTDSGGGGMDADPGEGEMSLEEEEGQRITPRTQAQKAKEKEIEKKLRKRPEVKAIEKAAAELTTNENWTKKNKNELLFERLTKKWAK